MYFIVLSINIYSAYQFAKCIIVAVKNIGDQIVRLLLCLINLSLFIFFALFLVSVFCFISNYCESDNCMEINTEEKLEPMQCTKPIQKNRV